MAPKQQQPPSSKLNSTTKTPNQNTININPSFHYIPATEMAYELLDSDKSSKGKEKIFEGRTKEDYGRLAEKFEEAVNNHAFSSKILSEYRDLFLCVKKKELTVEQAIVQANSVVSAVGQPALSTPEPEPKPEPESKKSVTAAPVAVSSTLSSTTQPKTESGGRNKTEQPIIKRQASTNDRYCPTLSRRHAS